jgi:hypothetical protein
MNFRRIDISFILCLLLFFCIALTGLTGYLQVSLDIHRFVLHKYLAYSTLSLTLLHLLVNRKKVIGHISRFLHR